MSGAFPPKVVTADEGKARGTAHACNAGSAPAKVAEILCPAGLEE